MYKMYTFSIIKTWSEIDVEAIKYNGKKWINEKHIEKAIGYKNLAGNKIQYYSYKIKKRRFIAEELAVHLILDIKTAKTGKLKI